MTKKRAKKQGKRPPGRPSTYTEETATRVCDEIACGGSLRRVCKQDWAPGIMTWFRWLEAHPELRERYARARDMRLQLHADEIVAIADDERIPVDARRVMVDARKWTASKLDRKTYGDQQVVEHTGHVTLAALLEEVEQREEPPSDVTATP